MEGRKAGVDTGGRQAGGQLSSQADHTADLLGACMAWPGQAVVMLTPAPSVDRDVLQPAAAVSAQRPKSSLYWNRPTGQFECAISRKIFHAYHLVYPVITNTSRHVVLQASRGITMVFLVLLVFLLR